MKLKEKGGLAFISYIWISEFASCSFNLTFFFFSALTQLADINIQSDLQVRGSGEASVPVGDLEVKSLSKRVALVFF